MSRRSQAWTTDKTTSISITAAVRHDTNHRNWASAFALAHRVAWPAAAARTAAAPIPCGGAQEAG